jgi:glucuronosyltransferase
MKHTTLPLVVITSSCVSLISSSRILALFPYVGKSHFDVIEPFVKELSARGHQVVVLGHFPQKYPVVNYTDISLVGFNTVDSKERVDLKSISGIVVLKTTVKEVAEFWEDFDKILSFHTVQELLKSEENV